jgi:hypothetical protein
MENVLRTCTVFPADGKPPKDHWIGFERAPDGYLYAWKYPALLSETQLSYHGDTPWYIKDYNKLVDPERGNFLEHLHEQPIETDAARYEIHEQKIPLAHLYILRLFTDDELWAWIDPQMQEHFKAHVATPDEYEAFYPRGVEIWTHFATMRALFRFATMSATDMWEKVFGNLAMANWTLLEAEMVGYPLIRKVSERDGVRTRVAWMMGGNGVPLENRDRKDTVWLIREARMRAAVLMNAKDWSEFVMMGGWEVIMCIGCEVGSKGFRWLGEGA